MIDAEAQGQAPAERQVLQAERLRRTLRRIVAGRPGAEEVLGRAAGGTAALERLVAEATPADLPALPFTTKDDFRAWYPFGGAVVPRDRLRRLHASSGTTGPPTVTLYTADDLAIWGQLAARALDAAGVGPGDVFHNAMHYGLFTGAFGMQLGADQLGLLTVPAGSGQTARQLRLLCDLGVTVLHVTPSYALHLLELAGQTGIDLRPLPLRVLVCGAEPWTDGDRTRLEAGFGARVVDHYGLSEVLGPGVAFECPERGGLHLNEDHFLPEVIDPDSGRPLPEGEEGELVLTTLTREAVPVLRYRTRDLTRLLPGPCACGRTLRRMVRIRDRTDDMLIFHGVNVFPSQVAHVLSERHHLPANYQLVVAGDRRRPEGLEVRVELPPATAQAPGGSAAFAAELRRDLESHLGIRLAVTLLPPGSVPRSEGKAVRVISSNGTEPVVAGPGGGRRARPRSVDQR